MKKIVAQHLTFNKQPVGEGMKYLLSLAPVDRYHVMGALRGPDAVSDGKFTVKAIVTGRLRAMIFPESTILNYGVTYEDGILTQEDLRQVERAVKHRRGNVEHEHWIGHLASAVEVTQAHPIWGGYGNALAQILYHSTLKGKLVPKDKIADVVIRRSKWIF